MAIAYIREYTRVKDDADGHLIQVPMEPGVDMTPVSYTTATLSTAFASDTHFVTVICDAKTHYKVGLTPTATTNNLYVPADTMITFSVIPGQKVSFLAA